MFLYVLVIASLVWLSGAVIAHQAAYKGLSKGDLSAGANVFLMLVVLLWPLSLFAYFVIRFFEKY